MGSIGFANRLAQDKRLKNADQFPSTPHKNLLSGKADQSSSSSNRKKKKKHQRKHGPEQPEHSNYVQARSKSRHLSGAHFYSLRQAGDVPMIPDGIEYSAGANIIANIIAEDLGKTDSAKKPDI